MKKFIEYIKSERDEYKTGLDVCFSDISESSLSRLLDQTKTRDFAIISAYRKSNSKEKNVTKNRELRTELNKNKLGVHSLVGYWLECQDSTIPYDQCPDEKKIPVIERSYFVARHDDITPEDFRDLLCSLAEKYSQDAIVLKISELSLFGVYDPSNLSEFEKFQKGINIDKLSRAYSKHVKKMNIPFVFEGVETPSGGVYAFRSFYDLGFRW